MVLTERHVDIFVHLVSCNIVISNPPFLYFNIIPGPAARPTSRSMN